MSHSLIIEKMNDESSMIMNTLSDVYLNQAAVFLPNPPVSNEQMEQVLGMVGDVPSRVRRMILRSNGIQFRHYAMDAQTRAATHSCTELAALAVEALFQQGVDKTAIGCLSCGTSYPDQILPGHGVMVHGLLKEAPPYEVASLAGVCVAGMAAMKYAFHAIKTGEHRHAIACAAETASAIMRKEAFQAEVDHKQWADAKPEIAFEKDFLRWMLSDGAGAVYLSHTPNPFQAALKIHWIDLISYANEMPPCMYAGAEIHEGAFTSWKTAPDGHQRSLMSIKQDVKLLNEHIIHYTVEKALQQVLHKHPLRAEDIDYFLPHYSSGFFRERVYQALKQMDFELPYHKWFTNLPSKGNTGSASIYIMLEEFIRSTDLRTGQKILCYVPESGRFSSSFMLLEVVNGQA